MTEFAIFWLLLGIGFWLTVGLLLAEWREQFCAHETSGPCPNCRDAT